MSVENVVLHTITKNVRVWFLFFLIKKKKHETERESDIILIHRVHWKYVKVYWCFDKQIEWFQPFKTVL